MYPAIAGASDALGDTSKMLGADLVITGAYGHSRVREWLIGGMTNDLLAPPTLNRFMSNQAAGSRCPGCAIPEAR
jgi:hypothetical protein